MEQNNNGIGEVKRKLRKLKSLEKKIRKLGDNSSAKLVWNDFFEKKYPAGIVAAMDKDTYRMVVEEYFYFVYYEFYAENKNGAAQYDPEVLARLGLPPYADAEMIKQKFRELAKIYHPDAGGDAGEFIKLKNNYDSLMK